MVTQYVGFLGAWNHAGADGPLANGLLGALVTTYVTFLPCFMFIFVGAPYVEALASARRVQAALTGVTAAVVGVILNLAVFFGERVLVLPGGKPDWFALPLAIAAFAALRATRLPLPPLVGLGALLGIVRALLG
jgi:chromate transporter